MKITIEQKEHSTERLNESLGALTKLLNQHFVGSGNSISFKEPEKDDFPWTITIEIGWEKNNKPK